MYAVNGTTIRMTRGDTVIIQVGIQRNGDPYTPQEGDSVRFALKHATLNSKKTAYTDKNPLLTKAIPNDTLLLRLDPWDTKPFDFGDYAYDIQITFADGRIDTFIAEARLQLLPEVD